MINLNILKESIYKASYFSVANGSLIIQNEVNPASGTLSFVEMSSKGTFINISNKLLKDGCDIYQSEDRVNGHISFRRDCDGVCLLELNGRKILLIIEIKSGFNELKKKAFEQLVSSYVKTRIILQSIEGYNPSDYEEIGLLFSYPPSGTATISTSGLLHVKSSTIAPTVIDKLNAANAAALRVNQEVVLDLNKYMLTACHVKPVLYSNQLLVKHVPIDDLKTSETVNIDSYL